MARDTQLNRQAQQLSAQGHYADAIPLLEQSVAIREKAFGPDDVIVAASTIELARLCRATGRYADAVSFYQRTMAIRENIVTPEVKANRLPLMSSSGHGSSLRFTSSGL